jgi:hypothetical protein
VVSTDRGDAPKFNPEKQKQKRKEGTTVEVELKGGSLAAAKTKASKKNWWKNVTEGCPISLETIGSLPYPPFALRLNVGSDDKRSVHLPSCLCYFAIISFCHRFYHPPPSSPPLHIFCYLTALILTDSRWPIISFEPVSSATPYRGESFPSKIAVDWTSTCRNAKNSLKDEEWKRSKRAVWPLRLTYSQICCARQSSNPTTG